MSLVQLSCTLASLVFPVLAKPQTINLTYRHSFVLQYMKVPVSENPYLGNVEKQNLSLGHPRLMELFLQVQHEKEKSAYQPVN